MNKRYALFIFLVAASLLSLPCISQQKNNSISKQEKKEDGNCSLMGKTRGASALTNKPTNSWEVLNGELHCKGSVTDKTDLRSDLMTTDQFDNFEVTLLRSKNCSHVLRR